MIRLTNKQRTELIEAALRDAFVPRFEALRERLNAFAAQKVREEHPAFVAARADEATRPYLATTQTVTAYVPASDGERDTYWREPLDYATCSPGSYHEQGHGVARRNGLKDIGADGDFPAYRMASVTVDDADIQRGYHDVWENFIEAKATLEAIVWQYSAREKLEADFPNLAKYLPPVVQKCTALSVPVEALKERLALAGVPPTC